MTRAHLAGYSRTTLVVGLALLGVVWLSLPSPHSSRAKHEDHSLFSRTPSLAPEAEPERPASSRDSTGLNIVPIARIPSGSLTVKEFFDRYGDQTVIVEGEAAHHPAFRLGFEGLRDLCPDAQVDTNVYNKDSDDWAGQSDNKQMALGTFVDEYIYNKNGTGELRYAGGGVGIPEVCPPLDYYTLVPKYASCALIVVDVEHETSEGERLHVQQAQPEMFLGSSGTKSEIHMDSLLTGFWMSVYIGEKTFRTISFEDAVRELTVKSSDTGEEVPYFMEKDRYMKTLVNETSGEFEDVQLEIWDPDLELFPELAKITIQEGTLGAGDWIFLPPATLHGVSNSRESWAVSVNSLYPAAIETFVEVCSQSNFALLCLEFAAEVGECNLDLINTKEDLRNCLSESAFVQGVISEFESGRCEDKSLHEMSGFADYESWCQVICETLRNEPGDPEEGMEEYEERKERVNRICDLCSYRGL